MFRNRVGTLVIGIAGLVGAGCTAAEPYRGDPQNFRTGSSGGAGGTDAMNVGGGAGGTAGSDSPDGDIGGMSGSGGVGGTGGETIGSGGSVGSGGAIGTGGNVGSGGAVGTGGSVGSGGAVGTGGSVGSGGTGTGGAVTVDGCQQSLWSLSVNTLCDTPACTGIPASQEAPPYAIDGNSSTRYTTGRPQGSAGAESVILKFPHTVTISGVHLVTSSIGDGPSSYRLQYSTDGTNFSVFNPPVSGRGADDLLISFPAKTLKSLQILQTGSKTYNWWSIHEMTTVGCTN